MGAEHDVKCECGQCGSPESVMAHELLGRCAYAVATTMRADLTIVFAVQRGRGELPAGMSALAEATASRATRRAAALLLRDDAGAIERAAGGTALAFGGCDCVAHRNAATASEALVTQVQADLVVVCALRRHGHGYAASGVSEVMPAERAARAEMTRMMRQVADSLDAAGDGAIRMSL